MANKENPSEQPPRIHVESHDQKGGITAYQVITQPGDRELKEAEAQQLKSYLSGFEFISIEVIAVMGDGEAFRLASQVKNFLVSEGFNVTGVDQVAYSAPVQGQYIEHPDEAGVVRVIVGNR